MSEKIPGNVIRQLSVTLESKPDKLAQILYFLAQVEETDKYVQILTAVLSNHSAFNSIVDKLIEDTDKFVKDPKYYRFMSDIWNNYLKPNEKGVVDGQDFDYQLILSSMDKDSTHAIISFNYIFALSRLPPSVHSQMINTTVNLAESLLGGSTALMVRQTAENSLKIASSSAGKVVAVSIVAVALAWDVIQNINRWWKGEISGVRCIKHVIDDTIGAAAGVGGGFAGMAIGSFF